MKDLFWPIAIIHIVIIETYIKEEEEQKLGHCEFELKLKLNFGWLGLFIEFHATDYFSIWNILKNYSIQWYHLLVKWIGKEKGNLCSTTGIASFSFKNHFTRIYLRQKNKRMLFPHIICYLFKSGGGFYSLVIRLRSRVFIISGGSRYETHSRVYIENRANLDKTCGLWLLKFRRSFFSLVLGR